MTNKLLEIKDLHVEYHTDDARVFAVNGIDLDVNEGETLGLVGETGAGKTTTALSVLKLLPERTGRITGGRVFLEGKDITDYTDADMRAIRGEIVSMIFQDPMTSLNPVLTVGFQIAEVLKLHKKAESGADIQKRVDEILRLVDIPPERKHDYPHQFSGGMKQRIVIAIALACEPKLLLADEPTTALDVITQAGVLKLLMRLKAERDLTVLLVTHDLPLAASVCDELLVMKDGELVERGTPKKLIHFPEQPYTRRLVEAIL